MKDDSIKIFFQRISKKGVFDLNKVVKNLKDYLKDHKYFLNEKQNISKATDKGNEITLDFIAEKEIDDFYAYKITVDFLVTNLNKVSVKEKKLDKGEVEIRITPRLILDHNNKFRGWLGDFLFKLYKSYVIKDKINKVYTAKLYVEAMGLFDLMKHDMDLY